FVQDRQSGKKSDLTEKVDRSAGSFEWLQTSNQKQLLCTAEDRGDAAIHLISENGEWKELARLHADDVMLGYNGLGNIQAFFSRMSIRAPNEIWRLVFPLPSERSEPQPFAVTDMNDALLSN